MRQYLQIYTNEIFFNPKLSSTDVRVFAAILYFMGKSGSCLASISTISTKSCNSVSSVKRSISVLKSLDIIRTKEQGVKKPLLIQINPIYIVGSGKEIDESSVKETDNSKSVGISNTSSNLNPNIVQNELQTILVINNNRKGNIIYNSSIDNISNIDNIIDNNSNIIYNSNINSNINNINSSIEHNISRSEKILEELEEMSKIENIHL